MKTSNAEVEFDKLKTIIRKHEAAYDLKAEIRSARMILDDAKKSGKHWVLAWECCNEDYKLSTGVKLRCSHRMPARLTDCYQLFPDKYESRRVGRYVAYRAL